MPNLAKKLDVEFPKELCNALQKGMLEKLTKISFKKSHHTRTNSFITFNSSKIE